MEDLKLLLLQLSLHSHHKNNNQYSNQHQYNPWRSPDQLVHKLHNRQDSQGQQHHSRQDCNRLAHNNKQANLDLLVQYKQEAHSKWVSLVKLLHSNPLNQDLEGLEGPEVLEGPEDLSNKQ